ncbi:MAG: hypothetical protein ACKVOW_00990 [Chitinophagaceae bacterium]
MKSSNNDQEKPPLFKNWKGWYLMVILFLMVLIVVFYLVTKHFS